MKVINFISFIFLMATILLMSTQNANAAFYYTIDVKVTEINIRDTHDPWESPGEFVVEVKISSGSWTPGNTHEINFMSSWSGTDIIFDDASYGLGQTVYVRLLEMDGSSIDYNGLHREYITYDDGTESKTYTETIGLDEKSIDITFTVVEHYFQCC